MHEDLVKFFQSKTYEIFNLKKSIRLFNRKRTNE